MSNQDNMMPGDNSGADPEVFSDGPTLLPCPFCGEAPTVQAWHGGPPTKRMIMCESDDCDASPQVAGDDIDLAANSWNTRVWKSKGVDAFKSSLLEQTDANPVAQVRVTETMVVFGNCAVHFDKIAGWSGDEGPERDAFYRNRIIARELLKWRAKYISTPLPGTSLDPYLHAPKIGDEVDGENAGIDAAIAAKKYTYGWSEEEFFGTFPSIDAALAAARADDGTANAAWIGEVVIPDTDGLLNSSWAARVVEDVNEALGMRCGEAAEDNPVCDPDDIHDLQVKINTVVAEWLKGRVHCFEVENATLTPFPERP